MGSKAALSVSRLGWAGVKIVVGNHTLLIDPLGNPDLWGGPFRDEITQVEVSTAHCSALITHMHQDHFDPETLASNVRGEGKVYSVVDTAAAVSSYGLPVEPVALWAPVAAGPVRVVAVPASDGFGIPQVSWAVILDGLRVIHCGDTLWHGAWWDIGATLGPFDIAFVPINGFRWKGRKPDTDVPSSLTPEQAIAAARVLGADRVVPIHYGLGARFYEEEPDAVTRTIAAGEAAGILVDVVTPGAEVRLAGTR